MRIAIPLSSIVFFSACAPRAEESGPKTLPEDTQIAACTEDSVCGSGLICEQGSCVVGDRDNSLEDATAMIFEEDVAGAIAPEGDADWYAVSGEAGHFVRITTVSDTQSGLDTVVSLYDDIGHRLAWEDGYAGGSISSLDTLLYAYFPTTATYYIKVEDVQSFTGVVETTLGEDASYTLTVSEAGDGGDEPDTLYAAGLRYDIAQSGIVYPIPFHFSEAGDSDYASITLPYTDCPVYLFTMQHDDASEASPVVQLYNDAGELVASAEDPARDDGAQLLAAQGQSYVIALSDRLGRGGEDDWGWAFVIIGDSGDGNPREQEVNDTLAQANVLSAEPKETDSGTWIAFYGQGFIDRPEDMDVFAFQLSEEMYISLALSAQDTASLLISRLEVLDSTGAVLDTTDSEENLDHAPLNLGPYPAGDYYLRVSPLPGSNPIGGEGWFYKFGVHSSTFTFSN